MIELIFMCVVSAKLPSNPPPPPPPAKIVAVLPPEEQKVAKDVEYPDDSSSKNTKGQKPIPTVGKKIVKRQFNRRGIRSSKVVFDDVKKNGLH